MKLTLKDLTIPFLTLIIPIILNSITSSLKQPDGQILLGFPVSIDSITYQQNIIVCNFNKNTIQGIDFKSENGSILKYSIDGEQSKIPEDSKQFSLLKSYPHTNVLVSFTLKKKNELSKIPKIIPLNHYEFNFEQKELKEWNNYHEESQLSIIYHSVITSVILLFFYFLFRKLSADQISTIEAKLNKVEKAKEKVSEEQKDTRKMVNRMKLLLGRELRDHRRENEYYRLLLKELLKSNSTLDINSEELQLKITKALKTYQTQKANFVEFDIIDIATNIINENNASKEKNTILD